MEYCCFVSSLTFKPFAYCKTCGNAYRKCCLRTLQWQVDENWECPSCKGVTINEPTKPPKYTLRLELEKKKDQAEKEERTEFNNLSMPGESCIFHKYKVL